MDGIFGWTLGRRYPGRRYRRRKRADLARRSRPSPKRIHAHHRAVSPPRSRPHGSGDYLQRPEVVPPPYSIKTGLTLLPDIYLIEYGCAENEKDRVHLGK